MKQLLVIAALLWASTTQAQTGDWTGNLVQPTIAGSNTTPWVNSVYQPSLTCFGWGDPGYCGPNSIATPGYNLNFSFGLTDTYQQQTIGSLLPNSGTGLRVDGYQFSFRAKNGNNWDNGQLDILSAYVQFIDPKGNTILNNNYNLNYLFGWTDFNYNYTLATPMATKDIGSVRYGFVGKDTNFWAGPYGPEVTNINFRLQYSVDPCAGNPLYSASCPGFSTALAAATPTSTVPVESAPQTTTAAATPSATATSPASTTSSGTFTARPVLPSQPSTVSSTGPTSAVAMALGVVARNQQREQSLISDTVSLATAVAAEAAESAQQTAHMAAAQAVQSSTAGVVLPNGQGLKVSSVAAAGSTGLPQESLNAFAAALLDRTSPLNQFMEPRLPEYTPPAPAAGPVVNARVADNEAAGGVDIGRMAMAPQGFADYTQLTLRDAAFYAPREVYRNQRTVDNQRALRQLSSDGLHRRMVEQQYQ